MHVNMGLHGPLKPIVIVGMACKFPGGVTSPSKLWELCAQGQDAWSEIPKERFNRHSFSHGDHDKQSRSNVLGGYFLEEDVGRFDAGFFDLDTEVASAMDPQIRLLLENVYEATEDAGIPLEKLSGSNTSVFAGCFSTDYQNMQTRDPENMPRSYLTASHTTMFANRISHFYDLRGASMTIDTGCSSGLVALHQACQSIRSGESSMSIVGASSLLLSPDMFIAMSAAGILNLEGRCYPWDSRAQGYGRGEGVATLILKSLDTALRDGDRIHAVIRDISLNQNGKTTEITSPSIDSQVTLIEASYARAGLDIAGTSYVEADMTGASDRDVAEAEALAKTFGTSQAVDPVLVGSVKTNIGHTGPASGLASIVKTTFALKKGQIAPNLNFVEPNPKIKLEEWRLQIPTRLSNWPEGMPLQASINNFGYGGTNVHVILEGPPFLSSYICNTAGQSFECQTRNVVNRAISNGAIDHTTNGLNSHSTSRTSDYSVHSDGACNVDRSRIFIISAKDPNACQEMAKNLSIHLHRTIEDGNEPRAEDLAYTLAERRSRLPWAIAARASNVKQLAENLKELKAKALHSTKSPRVGFVFNGQGAQWHAMGRELLTAYPIFTASIHKADQILRGYGATWSLYDELLRDEGSTRVAEINLAQPMSVALQLCLVDLLRSWGIVPSSVTSHSTGEIAAAYAIGALTFEEALGIAYLYGELLLKYQRQTGFIGGMLVAGISSERVEDYIRNTTDGHVVLACINSPESVTLSGDVQAIDEVATRLEKDGLFARKLKVPLAYHSHHMRPMVPEYVEKLAAILPEHPRRGGGILFASPVTGSIIAANQLTPTHWGHNLTDPVLFSSAFESMCNSGAEIDIVLEVGAHSTLAGPIRQILKGRTMPYVSCLKRCTDAVETMQSLACELLVRGFPVNLRAVNSPFDGEVQRFVSDLPTYPWNHATRYWTEPRISRELRQRRFAVHELLGLPVPGGLGSMISWRNFLRLSDLPWLGAHPIDAKVALPSISYVAMAIEAIRLFKDPSGKSFQGYQLKNVTFANELWLSEAFEVEVHTSIHPCKESEHGHRGWYEFEIGSMDSNGSWTHHSAGYIAIEMGHVNKSKLSGGTKDLCEDSFFSTGSRIRNLDLTSLYDFLRQMNLDYGPTFRNLISSRTTGEKTVVSLAISEAAAIENRYVIHPTTLGSIMQALIGGLHDNVTKGSILTVKSIGSIFVPQKVERRTGSILKAFVTVRKHGQRTYTSDFSLRSDEGNGSAPSTLQVDDLRSKEIPLDPNSNSDREEVPQSFEIRWELDTSHHIPMALKDTLRITLNDDEREFEQKIVRCSYHLIHDAVTTLRSEDKQSWALQHKIFYNWMEHIVKLGTDGAFGPRSETWSKTSRGMKEILYDELDASNASGKLIVRVGRKLANILRGEITHFDLMREGTSLKSSYMEMFRLKTRTLKQLRTVIALYAAQTPGANVLEIGAGNGGLTQTVLESFASRDGMGSLIGRYIFTDISTECFKAAEENLSEWQDLVHFKLLDIESDPIEQGFQAGTYDLILASCVFHASQDPYKALHNMRNLLKPGGKLLFIEAMGERLDIPMVFGTVPSWWKREETFQKGDPSVSLDIWNDLLKQTGFDGVDFDVYDCEDEQVRCSRIIMATAAMTPSFSTEICIVYTDHPPQSWIEGLSQAIFAETGRAPTVEALEHISHLQNKVFIHTAELIAPFVQGIDNQSLSKLEDMLTKSRGVLWLSASNTMTTSEPAYAHAQGLLRVLRQENPKNRYVHLDFEQDNNPWSADKIDYITHVLKRSFDDTVSPTDIEWEYAVKNSALYIPRVHSHKIKYGTTRIDAEPQPQLFYQPHHVLEWNPNVTGTLSTLHFIARKAQDAIPEGMVRLSAKAFGVNSRDVLVGLGKLDETLIGHEVAGIITGLGANTGRSGLRIGDRVCGIAQGRFVSSSMAYWTSVTKIPDDMSFEDAAAIPIAYGTAYHCLAHIASLRKGQSVLIHAATGGVGQAAIVVAQHLGAEIYVTCSTEAKRDLLFEQYGIDASHIFSSRDISFAPKIMEATLGKGVDVVLNWLPGAMREATLKCVARFGRFVDIAQRDAEARRSSALLPRDRCLSYAEFDILKLNEYCGDLTHDMLVESIRIGHKRMVDNFQHIFPIQQYPISDMEEVMSQMQSGGHIGKLVIVPEAGERVDAVTHTVPLSLDTPNATYLVVEGMGRVGHDIAVWMIGKGAKNVLLVSLAGESNPHNLELARIAASQDCNLQMRDCDVSNEEEVLKLLEYCSSKSLAPIKGVIDATMVLEDTILAQMTLPQWRRATKVNFPSSANLHNHLPNLTFFVLLSSLACQGFGNAYQDALARHRTASGLPGISINLGIVNTAGGVTSEASMLRVQACTAATGITTLDSKDVLRLLESTILRESHATHACGSQIIVGLAPWHKLHESAAILKDRRFGTLRSAGKVKGPSGALSENASAASPTATLLRALETSKEIERTRAVARAITEKLAATFNISTESIELGAPVAVLGVDSLVAVELRNWISGTTHAKVSVFEVLQSESLLELAKLIGERSSMAKEI